MTEEERIANQDEEELEDEPTVKEVDMGKEFGQFFTYIKNNDLEKVKEFLERNAEVTYKNPKDNWDSLDWACNIGHKSVLEHLLRKMLEDYELVNKNYSTSLYEWYSSPPTGVKERKNKMNCIQWAVFKGNIECLHLLLISKLFMPKDGTHLIDIKDEMDNNLIHLAASVNEYDIIELLMSLGVNAESKNKRGHTPMDVCTDSRCKELLKKYRNCTTDYINNKMFEFNSNKFLCMESKEFVCAENQVYYQYMSSTTRQTHDRLVSLSKVEYQKLEKLEADIREAIASNNFPVLDDLMKVANAHKFLNPKFKAEASYSHTRIKKELELQDFINRLGHNSDYKKIKKNIQEIEQYMVDCKKSNIILSDSFIQEAKRAQKKLLAERNLRYNTLELSSKPITYKVLDEYTEFYTTASEQNVAEEYLSVAAKNIERMKGCLLAHKYLKLFSKYPEREYPYPEEIKFPDPNKPYNPKNKKKKGSGNFMYPKWSQNTDVLEEYYNDLKAKLEQMEYYWLKDNFAVECEPHLERICYELRLRRWEEEQERLLQEKKLKNKNKGN